MWADNETDLDLLGFDELVDELVVALTTPHLLPLTVGLLGDWGSGKSSLLRITRRELEAETTHDGVQPYLCVGFSPWLYEDYEDVKVALMTEVLAACRSRATAPEAQAQAERLGRFARVFGRRGRTAGRAAITAVPAVVPAILAAVQPDLADTSVAALQGAVEAVAPIAAGSLTDNGTAAPAQAAEDEIGDLPAFRREFQDLVASLDGVEAVVVFIDDLDRCLPETVVDTFEAIRLFLNSPKTAYVVAASREIVETAIDSRYPELKREGGRGIGHDYLEKMLQLQVSVPRLSGEQIESYINLLIAQHHLSHDDFRSLCDSLRERRTADPFAATFNAAVAREALGDWLTGEIDAELSWTGEISTALGPLRGNPRQITRFLNEMTWRRRAAARRRVDLRHDVLAKLMVLEEQSLADFQTLFDWNRNAGGPSPELALAEARARAGTAPAPTTAQDQQDPPAAERRPRKAAARGEPPEKPAAPEPDTADPAAEAAESWLARPRTKAWLQLPPELGHVDLRPYFSYFRDRLVVGSAAATLRPELQVVLGNLQSDVTAIVRGAVDACERLPEPDQDLLVGALLEGVLRRPDGPALFPACELAGRVHRLAPAVCEALAAIPHQAVPALKIPSVISRFKDAPGANDLLARWAASPVGAVAKAASAAARPRWGS